MDCITFYFDESCKSSSGAYGRTFCHQDRNATDDLVMLYLSYLVVYKKTTDCRVVTPFYLRCIHIKLVASNLRSSLFLLGRRFMEFSARDNSCILNTCVSQSFNSLQYKRSPKYLQENSTLTQDKGNIFKDNLVSMICNIQNKHYDLFHCHGEDFFRKAFYQSIYFLGIQQIPYLYTMEFNSLEYSFPNVFAQKAIFKQMTNILLLYCRMSKCHPYYSCVYLSYFLQAYFL